MGIGIALLVRGIRGRRRGDTPHCGKCEYNLTGLDSGRCPECGADLNPLRIVRGERHRRPASIVVGGLLLALALLPAVPAVRQIKWYQYAPTAWVMRDMRSGNAGKAWRELERRDKAGRIGAAHQRLLIHLCLDEQNADLTPSPRTEMIEYLARCYLAEALSDAQEARFHKQMVVCRLRVRPHVVSPDRVPFQVDHGGRIPCGQGLRMRVSIGRKLVDGTPTGRSGSGSGTSCGVSSGGAQGSSVAGVKPGKHELGVEVTGQLLQGSSGGGKVLHEKVMMLKAGFEVFEQEPSGYMRLVRDPAMADELRACIEPADLTYGQHGSKDINGQIRITAPPIGVAFDVFARIGEREYSMGGVSKAKGASTHSHVHTGWEDAPPTSCDIILRSSAKVARRTVDLFEIWEGELVYQNVPIRDARPPG